jgi:hypothetical protein
VSLPATLSQDQRTGERRVLETGATLRDLDRSPHDVRIDEISNSGCHIATLLDISIDTVVTLGIPEIGIREARLIRETAGGYGCAFSRPLNQAELAKVIAAQASDRIAYADFGAYRPAAVQQRLTPKGFIGATIVGAVLLSWATVALILYLAGAF